MNTFNYIVIASNHALLAFTLGLGSGIWRQVRARKIARVLCQLYPQAAQWHLTAVLYCLSWLMPASYVAFVIATLDHDAVRRAGTVLYQLAIVYLLVIVFRSNGRNGSSS